MRRVGATLILFALMVATGDAAGAQDAELRGTVVSGETGDAVAGAWIALEGEQWGTYSWNDGHFFLPEIPGMPRTYEVKALGYEEALLTLDPADSDLILELTPDPVMQEGLALFWEQVERRRHRGGSLRVFDRQELSFNGSFQLGDYLAQRGLRGIRGVCLDERPDTPGALQRQGHEFYFAETVGGYLRLYTEEFVELAARDRLQLRTEPRTCSPPVGSS